MGKGRNAGEEGSSGGRALNRREPDGCVEAVSSTGAAGAKEGQGGGEGQQAIREAEGGMTNGILGLREHNPPEGPSAS